MLRGHVLEGNDYEVHFTCVTPERKKKQPLLVFKQPPFYHK